MALWWREASRKGVIVVFVVGGERGRTEAPGTSGAALWRATSAAFGAWTWPHWLGAEMTISCPLASRLGEMLPLTEFTPPQCPVPSPRVALLTHCYLAPCRQGLGKGMGAIVVRCCRSVAKSCPTLCDPVDCSTPGFPVLHYLPEFAQTPVHWVSDAIQPFHPLSPPSPPALKSLLASRTLTLILGTTEAY